MPERPIKLSALLDDVAERSSTSAASGVSLNVLQDTTDLGKPRAGRFARPIKVVAMLLLVGIAATLAAESGFKPFARRDTGPNVGTAQPVKPEARPLSPSALDPAQFSKPVQQLMEYVQCLSSGGCVFIQKLSGEDAAMQFGYSRLFASAYEEIVAQSAVRKGAQKPMRGSDVVAAFESIVAQEQKVDQLLAAKERHAAAIAYLRALQNGDVLFPGPQPLAPAPQVVLSQLVPAFPGIDLDDPVFASIYRKTRDFAAARLSEAGEVAAPEVIAKFRTLLVESGAASSSGPTMCRRGAALAELTSVAEKCPQLRLSTLGASLKQEVAADREASGCFHRTRTDIVARFENETANAIAEMCQRVIAGLTPGKMELLEISN